MQIFIGSLSDDQQKVVLSSGESRHCIKVLRHKRGDLIEVIDGKGNRYKALITEPNPARCICEIKESKLPDLKKGHHLHIAISPTKNPDRIEWMIEKCTELGVDEFSFIICHRTEKKGVKTDRLKKISESAVKQSGQVFFPIINAPTSLTYFLTTSNQEPNSQYIAWCGAGPKITLKDIEPTGRQLVLIGPEGDFTEEEVEAAVKNQFKPLSLGEARLRTETAGLLIAATFRSNFL